MIPAGVQQNSRCSTLTDFFNKSNEEESVGSSNTNEVIITPGNESPSSQKRSDERETTKTAGVGSSNTEQAGIISEKDPCSQKDSEDVETLDVDKSESKDFLVCKLAFWCRKAR